MRIRVLANPPRVTEKTLLRLHRLGVRTIRDLLWHFPSRYEDFSNVIPIKDAKFGAHVTVRGEIKSVKAWRPGRWGKLIIEAVIDDGDGSINAVWFNQRYMLFRLKKGMRLALSGKISQGVRGALCITHPVYAVIGEKEEDSDTTEGKIIPVYPETKGITSRMLQAFVRRAMEEAGALEDPVPEEIRKELGFQEINEALRSAHFPKNVEDAKLAERRFAFEDLFLLQIFYYKQRIKLAESSAHQFALDVDGIKQILGALPFELTHDQKKALWEILQDLNKSVPMNRLLQGDVGSGKTVVAAIAALVVSKENYQSAFMAPTEVLAKQHYGTMKKFFGSFAKGVGLLTSESARIFYGDNLEEETTKKEIAGKISAGDIAILVGTHALIEKSVRFKNLGFVIVDEQHRFGVKQRAEVLKKNSGDAAAHFLSMSATPIPRTLSLTLFGDLDISLIRELPKDRKKIVTKIVSPENRAAAYEFIRNEIKKGRQAFVVCPRIEPPDEGSSAHESKRLFRALEAKAVKDEFERLSKDIFPNLRVGMLHGKMKAREKENVMHAFMRGDVDLLAATSVIEVGIDVPNANIIVIEGAERFGLAQLYQLRGRVGRGAHQSYCLLFTDSHAETTHERLGALLDAKNGFELAEYDLNLRGPGEFLGESQTGIPDLAMKALQNPDLVKRSREMAAKILAKDPALANFPELRARAEEFAVSVHRE